jgi:hypothetical protein
MYGERTIIGFVDFVVNLKNRTTDGTTIQRPKKDFRKRIMYVLFVRF